MATLKPAAQPLCCLFTLVLGTAALAQPTTFTPHIESYIANTSIHVRDVTTDCEGNIIYVGGTNATAFAVTPNSAGGTYHGGNSDIFVVKKTADGDPIFATLFGGNQYDRAYAVETDADGFIYIAGRAGGGMPTTACALQPTFAGDIFPNAAYGVQDGFILKLTPDGSEIVWCTYLGGPGRGFIRDIAVDSQGNVWAGLSVAASTFPHITPNAVQSVVTANYNSAAVKVSADGRTVLFGTFITDDQNTEITPPSIRVDQNDNAFMLSGGATTTVPVTAGAYQVAPAGGIDLVLSKFNSQGDLLFCTFLGGSANDGVETHGLEIDSQGRPIIASFSASTDFPIPGAAFQQTAPGSNNGIIAKLSADGSTLLSATYLGGSGMDGIEGVGVDPFDNIYVSGNTASANFPVTSSAMQPNKGSGTDGFLAVLNPAMDALVYSTFVGASGTDQVRACHVDAFGNFHGGGSTTSNNLPLVNAFDMALTGSLTGMAIVLTPDVPLTPTAACSITNVFTDPCLSTGTSERPVEHGLAIFADPSTGSIRVQTEHPVNIDLYTVDGRLIRSVKIYGDTVIPGSAKAEGIYLIRATFPDGSTQIARVVGNSQR